MISAIVFSRDRAAQLDLCLRSLAANAPWVGRTTVIFKPTDERYREGYRVCQRMHRDVIFQEEREFRTQVLDALRHGDHAMFVCDDNVMYRPLPQYVTGPDLLLVTEPSAICVSLRLGQNTTRCYSLRTQQAVPTPLASSEAQIWRWEWRAGQGDFGYPGSLDGHVFRTDQLRILISATGWDHELKWTNPNELEDHLHRAIQSALLPLMACYRESLLVGVPVNRVNDTHKRNRYGERYPVDVAYLNERFLRSHRLSLATIVPAQVDSAHCEFPLRFEQDVARSAA